MARPFRNDQRHFCQDMPCMRLCFCCFLYFSRFNTDLMCNPSSRATAPIAQRLCILRHQQPQPGLATLHPPPPWCGLARTKCWSLSSERSVIRAMGRLARRVPEGGSINTPTSWPLTAAAARSKPCCRPCTVITSPSRSLIRETWAHPFHPPVQPSPLKRRNRNTKL